MIWDEQMMMTKLTVWVPKDLHRAVKGVAASRGDTMTRIVLDAFRRYLAQDNDWGQWSTLLQQAERLRQAQRARRGEWQGPDIADLIAESRAQRTEEIRHAFGSR
jgi:hypothetical protein